MTSARTNFGEPVDVVLCFTQTGQQLGVLRGHARRVERTAFSPDNARAATASADGTVKLWDPTTQKEGATLSEGTRGVTALAFNGDGKILAAAGQDHGVRLWDTTDGRLLAVLRGRADSVWDIAFLPEGRGLVSVGSDGNLMIWGLDAPGTTVIRNTGDATPVGLFLADGRLATAHTRFVRTPTEQNHPTGRLQVIDSNSGKSVRTVEGWFDHIALSPDRRRLATAGIFDTTRVWDAETGDELAGLPNVVGPVVFGPAGKLVVGVHKDTDDRTLVVVDAATGEERCRLEGTARVRQLAALPDGSRLFAGYDDGAVVAWDPAAGKKLRAFRATKERGIGVLALRPDGKQLLAVGANDRTAVVLDADTGEERFKLKGHAGRVTCAIYSADGRRILTGGDDRAVKVWDAATGQDLMTFLDCANPVRWVALSDDGRRIAAGCIPGSEIILWDARPLDGD
jgi:WD40 repeat protein